MAAVSSYESLVHAVAGAVEYLSPAGVQLTLRKFVCSDFYGTAIFA